MLADSLLVVSVFATLEFRSTDSQVTDAGLIRQFNGLSQENRLFFVLARIGANTGAHPETPGGKGRQAKGGEGERDDEAKGGNKARGGAEGDPEPEGGETPKGQARTKQNAR